MKVKITKIATGKVSTYDYSKNNWRRKYAAMSGGSVIMWCPEGLRPGLNIRTSGRVWKVIP